jgi:transglycosylase-like protein with SLT domain
MSCLPRRRAPRPAAVRLRAWRGTAASGAMAAVLAGVPLAGQLLPGSPAVIRPEPSSPPPAASTHSPASISFTGIVLPDVAVIEPAGISGTHLAALARLPGVREVLAMDGAALAFRGHRVNVLAVDVQQFRSWTPLATASDQRLWAGLAAGGFVASPGAQQLLGLRAGARYRLPGASRVSLTYRGPASFGVAGADLVVSNTVTTRLGLNRSVVALLSAPGVAMGSLDSAVRAVLGGSGRLVSLRAPQLPVDSAPAGRPATYLQLFRASAARYCPGLSWTVLAAIGQIESGDGSNSGPSPAGALGPMQFLPSTWQAWGITAFGETGPPNVMDPYDAVPAAARYLCAAGAGTPAGLAQAVYSYNGAAWYVSEVLALASEYAQQYG